MTEVGQWSGAYDAVILGAGISGLVTAAILSERVGSRILVVDEYDHLGGNHIDRTVNGYTFDVGSLIFQDDSPLLDHFPELLPHYVPIEPTWARLNPQRRIAKYPISVADDILAGGPVEVARILMSAAWARLTGAKMRNARDFARFWIGERLLQRSGLDAYLARFYGIPPAEIDLEFARKRMLWISEHASVRSLSRKLLTRRRPGVPNRQLARPRGGFGPLYAVAAARLERSGVEFRLGSRAERITQQASGLQLVLDGGTIDAGRVVSTIPVDRCLGLCGIPRPPLSHAALLSLYFSFEGERGFGESILYNFSHAGAWKRLTVYSDFYGRVHGREYFTAEVVAEHVGRSTDRAVDDFTRHVRANGLFRGDLHLEGDEMLDNAYPIYRAGADRRAAEGVAALRAFGIESFGRQGAFAYQPTARVSTREAEASLGWQPSTP